DSQWFNSELRIVDAGGRRRRTVCPMRGHGVEGRISVSPDGRLALLCDAYSSRDLFHVVAKAVDLAGGRKRLVAPGFDCWSMNPQWLPDGRVFFESGARTSLKLCICSLGGRPQLLDTGPGVASLAALAPKAGRAFYAYSEAGRPDELRMSPMDGPGEAAALSNVNRSMGTIRLARSEVVSWRSKDGLEVEGILCLPSKRGARKPHPLVVMPHGGPYSASLNSYDRAAVPNAFCAAGYACFMPNFRGSIGYGRSFTRKIVRDWGQGPFTDIMTGVDALVRRGIVNRKRMAIFGVSYGGYITAWTIAHTNRFRCAVAVAAVVNNISMWGTTDVPTFMLRSSDSARLDFTDEFWSGQSPVYHAGRVRTPTLIITGEVDVRVPPGQSHELYRALKARGVETKLVLYPREPHGISEPRHRRHYLELILD
ncbi:MAG: S9 family peptidase, partial [Candidatus Brocadiae bacterium]|nr:S9 family peptidase [Candidatus Brocadiia bacterium]